jgi:hypothetical protein
MNTYNRHLPLLHGFVGVVLLIRSIKHLPEAMPTLLPAADTTPWANGYAVGQSLGIAVQLIAGVGLLALSIRESMASREKQKQRSSSPL